MFEVSEATLGMRDFLHRFLAWAFGVPMMEVRLVRVRSSRHWKR